MQFMRFITALLLMMSSVGYGMYLPVSSHTPSASSSTTAGARSSFQNFVAVIPYTMLSEDEIGILLSITGTKDKLIAEATDKNVLAGGQDIQQIKDKIFKVINSQNDLEIDNSGQETSGTLLYFDPKTGNTDSIRFYLIPVKEVTTSWILHSGYGWRHIDWEAEIAEFEDPVRLLVASKELKDVVQRTIQAQSREHKREAATTTTSAQTEQYATIIPWAYDQGKYWFLVEEVANSLNFIQPIDIDIDQKSFVSNSDELRKKVYEAFLKQQIGFKPTATDQTYILANAPRKGQTTRIYFVQTQKTGIDPLATQKILLWYPIEDLAKNNKTTQHLRAAMEEFIPLPPEEIKQQAAHEQKRSTAAAATTTTTTTTTSSSQASQAQSSQPSGSEIKQAAAKGQQYVAVVPYQFYRGEVYILLKGPKKHLISGRFNGDLSNPDSQELVKRRDEIFKRDVGTSLTKQPSQDRKRRTLVVNVYDPVNKVTNPTLVYFVAVKNTDLKPIEGGYGWRNLRLLDAELKDPQKAKALGEDVKQFLNSATQPFAELEKLASGR